MTAAKNVISASVLLAGLLMAVWGNAQEETDPVEITPECYRSAECEGPLICVDLVCVESSEPMVSCDDDSVCDFESACQGGYCKPVGVRCESEAGVCEHDSGSSWCECASGDGMGSGTAGPVETVPDEVLYEMCVNDLNTMCDETVPDPMEVCSEAEYETCVNVLIQIETLDDNCDDMVEVDTATVEWDTAWVVDGDTDDDWVADTEGVTDWDTAMEGDPDEPPPDVMDTDAATDGASAETQPAPPPAILPDAWEIVGCCEELQEASADTESGIDAFIECLMDLAPDDCDGLEVCAETYGMGGKDDSGGVWDTDGDIDYVDTEMGLDTEAGGDVEPDTDRAGGDADADTEGEPEDPEGDPQDTEAETTDNGSGDNGDGDAETDDDTGAAADDTGAAADEEDTDSAEGDPEGDAPEDGEPGVGVGDDGAEEKATSSSESSGCAFIAPARTSALMDLLTALF